MQGASEACGDSTVGGKCSTPKTMRLSHCIVSGAIVCGVIFAGCSKSKVVTEEEAPEPAPEVVTTPVPATPEPVAIAATPPPKRLAPEGTFFLLYKKSLVTDDGVIGFKPGTVVKQQPDGTFVAEGKVLQLQANEITNDIDIAMQVIGADAQRQAYIRQATAAQAEPTPAPGSSGSSSSSSSSSRSSGSAQTVSAPPPPPPSSSAVGASRPLGSTHTMTRDGWLWEKNQYGDWKRVRPLR